MPSRRRFLQTAAVAAGASLAGSPVAEARVRRRKKNPSVTFYGAARRVSGSCHILETSAGLFLVDCGLFMSDTPDRDVRNTGFPFDPGDVRAVFLTHAHTDHNGRLPLLVKEGFTGPIYCTDATRDLNRVMLRGGASVGEETGEVLFTRRDAEKSFERVEAVPYNRRVSKSGVEVRYTDAGHILGSSMIEVWADGRKILFSGDMGPDHAPLLCTPAQHRDADAVLVESTYGPVAKETVDFVAFGEKIRRVVDRGGSVLLPAFALHKTQSLIYVLNRLKADGVLPADLPVFSDSGSAQTCTRLYGRYRDYWDAEAQRFAASGDAPGSALYRPRYIEARVEDTLLTHGEQPGVYVSTSGMLDHAAAPRHLAAMAADPKNAVFFVGYQAPGTVGSRVRDGESPVRIPIEQRGEPTRFEETTLELEVGTQTGFSSHAKGQQILDWLGGFDSCGPVYVVHGDEDRAVGMADRATGMNLSALAPAEGRTFEVTGERSEPGDVPELPTRDAEGFTADDK